MSRPGILPADRGRAKNPPDRASCPVSGGLRHARADAALRLANNLIDFGLFYAVLYFLAFPFRGVAEDGGVLPWISGHRAQLLSFRRAPLLPRVLHRV